MRHGSWPTGSSFAARAAYLGVALLVVCLGMVGPAAGSAFARTPPYIAGQSHATNDCSGLISYRGRTSYATKGEHVVITIDGTQVADIPLETSRVFDGAEAEYTPAAQHVVVFTLWVADTQSNLVTIGVARVSGCAPIIAPKAVIHRPTCRGEAGAVVVTLDNTASHDGPLGPAVAQFVITVNREVVGPDPRTIGAGVAKNVTLRIANGNTVRVFTYDRGKHLLLAKATENLDFCTPPPVVVTPLAGPTCRWFFTRVQLTNTTDHAVRVRLLVNGRSFFETVTAGATVVGTFPTGGPDISMEVTDLTDHVTLFSGDGAVLTCPTPSLRATTPTPTVTPIPTPTQHRRRPLGAAPTGGSATPTAAAVVLGVLLVVLGLTYLARRMHLVRRMHPAHGSHSAI